MPNRRGRARRARQPRQESTRDLREVTRAINAQTLVTQTRSLPMQRDVIPMPLPRANSIYTTTRKAPIVELFADSVGTTGAVYFSLGSLPSYTDFTSLFDQYRIIEIRATFNPTSAPFGASTTAVDLPMLYTAIDYDDATVPANVDVLRQNNTCQASAIPNLQFRVLHPKFAVPGYQGTFTAYTQASPRAWCDCAYPDIQYYGLKYAITPVSVVSGSYLVSNLDLTYVLQFRNSI